MTMPDLLFKTTPLPASWFEQLRSPPPLRPRSAAIPDPPGFASGRRSSAKDAKTAAGHRMPTAEELDSLKLKKAWEVALAPAKSLPMTAIMMYMSGNSLHMFTVMMVFMAFKTPVAGLLALGSAFERFETPSNRARLLVTKVAYIAMHILALGLGLWKLHAFGLLPTTRSDWLAWESPPEPLEHAVVAL